MQPVGRDGLAVAALVQLVGVAGSKGLRRGNGEGRQREGLQETREGLGEFDRDVVRCDGRASLVEGEATLDGDPLEDALERGPRSPRPQRL
jgi:hypothetical protein